MLERKVGALEVVQRLLIVIGAGGVLELVHELLLQETEQLLKVGPSERENETNDM